MRRAWVVAIIAVLSFVIVRAAGAETCEVPGDTDAGGRVYGGTCVACHGTDGRGPVPGTPDLTKKGGPLAKPHAEHVRNITDGFSSGGPLPMPPRGGNPGLTDTDIANVHAYLHRAFGCGA